MTKQDLRVLSSDSDPSGPILHTPASNRLASDENDGFYASRPRNQGTGALLGCCLIERETGRIISSDHKLVEWTQVVLGTSILDQISGIMPDFQSLICDEKKQFNALNVSVSGPKCASLPVQIQFIELDGDSHKSTLLQFFSQQAGKKNPTADALTGLLDRSALADYVAHQLSRTPFVPFALLFLDLDQFKKINDEHGHRAGDQVLVEITRRWHEALRTDDFACRYGGDEFVIVLTGISDGKNVTQVTERLEAVTAEPVVINDQQLSITVSIGSILAETPSFSLSELTELADQEMYKCKRLPH